MNACPKASASRKGGFQAAQDDAALVGNINRMFGVQSEGNKAVEVVLVVVSLEVAAQVAMLVADISHSRRGRGIGLRGRSLHTHHNEASKQPGVGPHLGS